MELRQLKTFKAVATLLNFNRAAEALNYAQSTVSAQIKILEEDFGVPLFDRLGKRIVLTEAGQTLLQYADKMLSLANETFAQVTRKEGARGLLSIRAPQSIGTYYLPGVIESFCREFPNINFDISACAFHTLQQELKSGITDVAFLFSDMIASRELKTEVLGIERLVVAVPPGHRLTGNGALGAEDMRGETILLPKHDCSYKMVLDQMMSEGKVRPAVLMEYNSIEAIKKCVMRGIGITLLPAVAVRREVARERIAALSLADGPVETAITMIWHRDKWISPVLECFMNAARRLFPGNQR